LVPIGVRVRVVAGVDATAVVLDAAGVVGVVLALVGVGLGVAAVFVETGGSGFLVPIGVLGFAGVGEAEVAFPWVFFAPSATLATLD